MGQCAGSPVGGRSSSRQSSWRSVFRGGGWGRHSRGSMSATFNMMDVDVKLDLLNINMATEEELMTLPGIGRTVAQSIVEYRHAIGGFRKVEDLALVSGVGAARLDCIRPEICVRVKNLSRSSSQTQSVDSLPSGSTESEHRSFRSSPVKVVNVNTANVFELMTIHGINQELAANIVDYRSRKGPFQTWEDVVKVRGFNHRSVNALRCYWTLGDSSMPATGTCGAGSPLPAVSPHKTAGLGNLANGKIPGHCRNKSAPLKCDSTVNSAQDTKDIFELLSARSERPIMEEVFSDSRYGRPAVRIASWNLQAFSGDKASNPGVREVVCRTILENRLSLVALQEIVEKVAVEKICNELNKPELQKVQEWESTRGNWVYFVSSPKQLSEQVTNYSGYLYDSSRGVRLHKFSTVDLADSDRNSFMTEPLLGHFVIEQLEFSALNVQLKLPEDSESDKQEFAGTVQKVLNHHLGENSPGILLGDFSAAFQCKDAEQLLRSWCRSLLPSGGSTSSNSIGGHHAGFHDAIWLGSTMDVIFTGHCGVVRQGLSHLAIPDGWSWGGIVSGHCPVWCELYTDGRPLHLHVPNGGTHTGETLEKCK